MNSRPAFGLWLAASVLSVLPFTSPQARAASPEKDATSTPITLWTTGPALMPGWGIYPNGSEYGGTKPLDGSAAWTAGGRGWLTWVVDLPRDGDYQLFVRRYAGYGTVTVQADERTVEGGRGILGPGGGRYAWFHLGSPTLRAGSHHLDILVEHNMFDAVLLTTDPQFDPLQTPLPSPVQEPMRSAARTYRDDTGLKPLAGATGFVVGRAHRYAVDPRQQPLYDALPAADQLADKLETWGAADQYVNLTFTVRALEALGDFTASLGELTGPDGTRLGPEQIDLRIVHVRSRVWALFEGPPRKDLCADLLLRDDRTSLPPAGQQGGFGGGHCATRLAAHESRQFWLTVHIPAGSTAGQYRGTLELGPPGSASNRRMVPVTIDVLPLELRPVEGYYSVYYPSQPTDPKRPNYVTPERYLAELKDQVRHGLNAVTLYGGFSSLKYAQQAGMRQAPVLMHWPDGLAAEQVKTAREAGFADLYYYGVDEPHGPAIERCRNEAQRRMQAGLHMFTAINSRDAWEATKDFIDRPVYCVHVFSGKDNATVMYARSKGFVPISYWVTSVSFPLHHRALAGLYNTACGYQGTAPWAYQDYPDDRLYKADGHVHAVSYPDASGQPIPSIRWEAFRDGVDDVRYLQALDRAIARAQKRTEEPNPAQDLPKALVEARRVRKEVFESIDGRWFQYLCAVSPEILDAARWEMAQAIVGIEKQIR